MNQKTIAIAAMLAAAILTAIFTTTSLAYATASPPNDGDSSETETELKLKQKNVGSGESINDNCGANFIESDSNNVNCPRVPVENDG